LRSAQNVNLNGGGIIQVDATSPAALPWSSYTEISRRASHWRNGVWVQEIEEAYLPAQPA